MSEIERRKLLEKVDAELAKKQRQLALLKSRDSLIEYTRYTMPDIKTPDDPTKSSYEVKEFHRATAKALEQVERQELSRLIICMPPRMGKSELAARRFIPWCLGRNPTRNIIFGTYNQTFAEDFGKKIRRIFLSKQHAAVFPQATLVKGEKAAEYLGLEQGGQIAFVGRGGTTTGRGAHIFLVDDPIKDRAEANSASTRTECWEWFQDVVTTRMMDDKSSIILVQTRWHDDDIVGRLTDPDNPHYSPEYAAEWKIIELKALAEDDDILGRASGESLWPEKFSAEYFERMRKSMPRTFSALYQQRPAPADGNLFKSEWFRTYKSAAEMPNLQSLRIYAACDLAVTAKQSSDRSCMLVVGLDPQKKIWILDCIWARMDAKANVEAIIAMTRKWSPVQWLIEKGQLTRSIEPFLRERMRQEGMAVMLNPVQVAGDKVQKAQPIMGHMALGGVVFPSFQPWYDRAREEILKFDTATHDDFVDTLALFGNKLNLSLRGNPNFGKDETERFKPGTFGWFKEQDKLQKREKQRELTRAAA